MTGFMRFAVCAGLAVIFCAVVALGQEDEEPPFDVSIWLRRADHADFPWKVSVSTPALAMQQRFVVQVGATINLGYLKYIGLQRDLHFVLKVGNADSRWVPEYSYTRIPVAEGTNGANNVFFGSRVYLRPGRYLVALIVYDAILKKGNIYRKAVTVRPLKKDPLPGLDRNLPDVEFFREEPGRRIPKLDKGKLWLPVKNDGCLCVDIVANLSPPKNTPVSRGYQTGPRSVAPNVLFAQNALKVLGASSVLSQLGVRNGRVRVSILDALRMETYFDRADAADFDWQGATDALSKQNMARIDASVLNLQSQASAYLHGTLQDIMDDNPCPEKSGRSFRAIVIVSSEIKFPDRTIIQEFTPRDPATTSVFYYSFRSADYDDIIKMLKRAKPQRTYFYDSLFFRKTLADLIANLEAAG